MKAVHKKQAMDRFITGYSVDDIFSWIKVNKSTRENKGPKRVDMDGHLMKVFSVRYETFMQHGTTCCVCGVEGSVFYKERNLSSDGEYHFNLYAIDNNGDEVLMTKDHIVAKTHGGSDDVSNMQTMCTICNGLKGSMTVDQWADYLKIKNGVQND